LRTSTRKKRSEEEIREIQERKNQYVLMSELHQKMNAFHQALLDVSKQNEQSQSNIESKFVALSSRFQNLSELVDLKFKDLVDRIGKAESLSLVVSSKLRSLESILSASFVNKEEFEESVSSIENTVISNQLKQSLKNDNLNHNIEQFKGQTAENLKALKDELSPKPNQFDPIKAHLEEKMKIWKVDFDGIMKELAVIKKSLSYDQKKFENIYTLIERLKGEK